MPTLQTSSIPKPQTKRNISVLLVLAVLLCAAILLSLRCGSQNYSAAQLLSALGSKNPADPVRRIVLYSRIPRTLAALLAGSALAVSGALIQAVLNNAMASPNIIGVNAGAGFLVMLAAALFPGLAGLTPTASFLGAFTAAMFIYLLAVRAGLSRTTLILSGIAVNSIMNAGINAIILLAPDSVIGATGFMLGGFSGVTLTAIRGSAGYLAAGLLLAALLAPDLNLLQLGEESAAGLGLHISRTRFLAVLSAALLAGAAVSFSGLLSFVGLLVPHMARRLIGTDNRWLIPASALLGGSFVLLCDTLARVLFLPFEFPVGIIMSLLGGPFFLYLLLGQKRRRVYD